MENKLVYSGKTKDVFALENQGVAEENGVTFTECDVPAFQALCADLINEVANRSDMTKAAYEAIVSER